MIRYNWRALARSTSGNVLPMACMGMVVLAGLVGGGVDASRAYMVQNRLQNACDSAVLAGRRAVGSDGYDGDAEAQANTYFQANFGLNGEDVSGTRFVTTADEQGNQVEGTASTTMRTALMNLFGFEEMTLTATCMASMSVGNSDVVMVLDTTGSMASNLSGDSRTRLRALQEAMKNFYDTVATATAGSNARIRFGFVPYSSSVNVGRLIYDLNPNYLVDSYAVQSRTPVWGTEEYWGNPSTSTSSSESTEGTWSAWTTAKTYSSSSSCDSDKPDNGWVDYGNPSTGSPTVNTGKATRTTTTRTTQPQVNMEYRCSKSGSYYRLQYRYQQRDAYTDKEVTEQKLTRQFFDSWTYEQRDDLNYAQYKTFTPVTSDTGENGTDVTSTWVGCIEERETVNTAKISYSSLLGMSPEKARDLDIDSAPNSLDDSTRWRPMWPEVAYYRINNSGNMTYAQNTTAGRKASSYCPRAAQLLSEMDEWSFDAYANSLTAVGSTYHDLGMIWGARLASPTGIFQDTVTQEPDNGGSVARHVIFMTDGQMEPSNSIQSSYGIEYHDRRVTNNGSSDQAARHTSRFRAVCEATKAKGIRVWVIAFASTLTSDLKACASDESSFTAKSANELNKAFQEIAKDVGELRIVQ